ncbi:MAG: IS1634 family transposase, partial [Bacteroidota bacterium]
MKQGYAVPPSLQSIDLKTVRSYGPELALFRLAEELELPSLIDSGILKGGGPSLGKMVLALAVYACLRPGSVWRFVEWYLRSPLPIFMGMPPEQVTYEAALNALDYLQPVKTRPIEAETYSRVRSRFGHACKRIFIDSTPQELSGELCKVIAKFGHSKSGGASKRRQIIITFMVDQAGVLLGHEVFPGNKNDAKTLSTINQRLREGYGAEVHGGARVVDRGYASLANVRSMKRRKESFLVALRAQPKSLKLLEEIGIPHQEWKEVGEGIRAASVVRDGLKWVVTWNDEVAKRNLEGREAKMKKAREALEALSLAVAKGRVKSRSERDRKVGMIIRKHGVSRFLKIKGEKKGFGFDVVETGKACEKAEYDGYQVFVTTELDLTEKEVFDAYRARDIIEKVIRTLKSSLGLGPVYLTKKEHVLGHFYVHALAYQLRSVMALRLKEARVEMSPEEALWELEKLQVAELVVKGNEI